MTFAAILPIKAPGHRKCRLHDLLSPDERTDLTERLLSIAIEAVRGVADIAEIIIVSPERRTDRGTRWIQDPGTGLNEALSLATTAVPGNGLILLPDLPLVTSAEIAGLLGLATRGPAIAMDRHGTGTNAFAWPGGHGSASHFGRNSRARFESSYPGIMCVQSRGLAYDVDTAKDYRGLRQPA